MYPLPAWLTGVTRARASHIPSIRYSVRLLTRTRHDWCKGRSHSQRDASILMSEILLYYRRPDPTTWVYLSSFLTIGLYFVFHRFWSIRNVDILLLILLAPGLLMVHEGYRRQLQVSDALAKQKAERRESESDIRKPRAMTSLVGAMPIFALARSDSETESETNTVDDAVSSVAAVGV